MVRLTVKMPHLETWGKISLRGIGQEQGTWNFPKFSCKYWEGDNRVGKLLF